MSLLTSFLKLFKYDPIVDKDSTFNITQALNDNWDKIDADKKAQDDAIIALSESIGNIKIPVKSVNQKTDDVILNASDIKNSENKTVELKLSELSTQTADLAQGLNTHESKSATTSAKGHVELATNAEVTAGTDTTRAVTPAGLKVELDKKLTTTNLLTEIKKVDGAGSGLDADLLDGKDSSDFQSVNKLYGTIKVSDTVGINATITKNIPIGAGNKSAIVVLSNSLSLRGLLLFCGTDKTKTYGIAMGKSSYMDTISRQYSDIIAGKKTIGSDVIGNVDDLDIVDCYINGSNLTFVIKNNNTQYARDLGCNISWEVW